MARKPLHDLAEAFLLPILALTGALLMFGLWVWLGGHDPLQVWALLFAGAFGDAFSIWVDSRTIESSAPPHAAVLKCHPSVFARRIQ